MLAKEVGVKQKTISVWCSDTEEHKQECPNFAMLLRICRVIRVTINELCYITLKQMEKNQNDENNDIIDHLKNNVESSIQSAADDESYNSSTAHKKRLKHYENIKCNGYYFRTNRNDENVVKLLMEMSNVVKSGFIRVEIVCNEQAKYIGKAISPENQGYTYIYFNRNDDFPERCVLILCHPHGIGEAYIGGLGYMMSLSKGYIKAPVVQKIAVISRTLDLDIDNNTFKGFLSINDSVLVRGIIRFSEFEKENTEFVEWLKSQNKQVEDHASGTQDSTRMNCDGVEVYNILPDR